MEDTNRWLHPGFTRDTVLNYLFKKSIGRVDTSLNTSYYQEGFGQSNLFLDYLATDDIPQRPPDDFETLTAAQIALVFGIHEHEVSEFETTLNGSVTFSVERSVSKPHILRVNNLLLKPTIKNINGVFSGLTSRSRVNIISQAIHSSFGKREYTCTIKRTGLSGELSLNGADIVNMHKLAYIFDADNGVLTLHEADSSAINPIKYSSPPALSCYIYRGNYGRLGWQVKNNAIILDETQLLLGKQSITDPTLIMDVSGAAFIEDLYVNSVTTYSDIRLKENIVTAETNYGVLDLNPVYYNYKTKPDVKEYGLIAQEVQKVAPEIVRQSGDHLAVQYDRIGALLIPIVKQQEERIQRLEIQVASLIKLLEKAGDTN